MYNNMCVEHIQQASHADSRGSGGMPPRKILKIICHEITSGAILEVQVQLYDYDKMNFTVYRKLKKN